MGQAGRADREVLPEGRQGQRGRQQTIRRGSQQSRLNTGRQTRENAQKC